MVVSIDEVSKNAENTADMALKSIGIAKNGGEIVRRNIDGMDRINVTTYNKPRSGLNASVKVHRKLEISLS